MVSGELGPIWRRCRRIARLRLEADAPAPVALVVERAACGAASSATGELARRAGWGIDRR
jgi:hypothetical protein